MIFLICFLRLLYGATFSKIRQAFQDLLQNIIADIWHFIFTLDLGVLVTKCVFFSFDDLFMA